MTRNSLAAPAAISSSESLSCGARSSASNRARTCACLASGTAAGGPRLFCVCLQRCNCEIALTDHLAQRFRRILRGCSVTRRGAGAAAHGEPPTGRADSFITIDVPGVAGGRRGCHERTLDVNTGTHRSNAVTSVLSSPLRSAGLMMTDWDKFAAIVMQPSLPCGARCGGKRCQRAQAALSVLNDLVVCGHRRSRVVLIDGNEAFKCACFLQHAAPRSTTLFSFSEERERPASHRRAPRRRHSTGLRYTNPMIIVCTFTQHEASD
jgi:hypothetical protein